MLKERRWGSGVRRCSVMGRASVFGLGGRRLGAGWRGRSCRQRGFRRELCRRSWEGSLGRSAAPTGEALCYAWRRAQPVAAAAERRHKRRARVGLRGSSSSWLWSPELLSQARARLDRHTCGIQRQPWHGVVWCVCGGSAHAPMLSVAGCVCARSSPRARVAWCGWVGWFLRREWRR